jgi:hypothetical protein
VRKQLLASTLGLGAALAPAALAADSGSTTPTNDTPYTSSAAMARGLLATNDAIFHPLMRERLERDAAAQLRAARERAERRRERARRLRAKRLRAQRAAVSAPAPASAPATGGGGATPGHLAAIAACESGGNPGAIGGGGAYRGKYQFSYSTWASVGGSGDPAAASEAEQDRRAAILYSQAGASPWPTCGR